MHIALIGSHPFPGEPVKGGVQRVVHVLRRGLAQRLHVSLVVPSAQRNLRHADEYGEIVYLKRPPTPGFMSYWSWVSRDVYREVERLRPDLVHVQDVAGLVRSWPGRKGPSGQPMIFTAHGVLETDILQNAESDVLRRVTASARAAVVGAVERSSRSRYDSVIVINEYVLQVMPDVAGIRHHLIPNPVDEAFFSTPRADRPDGQTYNLIQVGMITPLKNIVTSINVLHEMTCRGMSAHLHIIGPPADDRYYRHCRSEVARLKLEAAVTFHGSLTAPEIAARMDQADVLLLTSRQEVAPMVVAEAHCRGLPVAAPRAFGLRSMVTEGVNGIFLDGPTPADDARRIGDLLTGAIDRNAIRRDAAMRYEPGGIINRTIEVYREALGALPAPAPQFAEAGL